jgi:UDP-2,4-diacetamido-2,4,6-trideoxy-beta-L-altropyranose hydrolase
MSDPLLVLRAEGGARQGAGHVARAVALGQAWGEVGLRAVLVAEEVPDLWRRRCIEADLAVVPPAQFDRSAGVEPGWAVLDGYDFVRSDQERWRSRCGRLLVVDDHGAAGTWAADLVLDQNLGATAATYATEATGPDLLLGPRYALLRREFRRHPVPHPSDGSGARRSLRVALAAGGSPTAEVTAWFDQVASGLTDAGLEVFRLEGVEDMVPALAEADLAVSAAGGTAWELCALGIPSVLVPAAVNQLPVASRLGGIGAAVAVLPPEPPGLRADAALRLAPSGDVVAATAALARDPRQRAALRRRARSLVDGRGAVRVVTRLRAELLELRPARSEDARTLWDWANDPGTRAQSFVQEPIPWDRHVAWLDERLADPDVGIYLAGDADGLVGQVRVAPVDPRHEDGGRGEPVGVEVGVVVAPARRGRHLAGPLIDAGVRRATRELGRGAGLEVVARIKVSNRASQRAFVAADFDPVPDAAGRAQGWLRYTRQLHEPER